MDEDRRQLRERLRRDLRLSPSEMESIWLKLEEMDVIGDFFEELYQFEDLVDDAKETEEYLRTGAASRSKRGRPLQEIKEYFEVKLDHKNEERAVALSEALACRADRHGEVIEFRENVLGGRLLAPERARDFLESPAVRHFMLVWFRNWGIPLLSHEAAVVLTDEDVEGFRWGPGVFETGFRPWIDRFVSVSVNPPGVTKNVLYGSHDIREPEGVRVDKRYFFRRSEEEDKHMRELPEVVVRYPWGGHTRDYRSAGLGA